MAKDTFFKKKQFIRIRGKLLDLTTPKIIGILNITPDSFYDGGRYTDKAGLMARIEKMLYEGADIIDIGAYSSRPGAPEVSTEEEMHRLIVALEPIRKKFPEIILSVDTFRSDIARKVIEDYQVDMINDISGGQIDPGMMDTIAEMKIPCIIMHMRGTPQTMQQHTDYDDLIKEVIRFLGKQVSSLLGKGASDILLDPGFGFSKTVEQNYALLANLDAFRILELPIVVGISRKSMIYKFLDIKPDEAMNGTTALHMIALEKGADFLRVHDVKEARQAIKLFVRTREETLKD
jgi:dihydropteroate synthase